MAKKKSPHSIQRTQQDVDKAYQRGYDKGFNEGIVGGLTIMLYVLRDKFNADDAQLREFSDAFNYVTDSIAKDYIKPSDLKIVCKEEYGTTLRIN